MYSFLLAVIYIAFIGLGLPDSLLGSGWPVMHVYFDVPVSFMGIVSMIIAAGSVVSGLFSDKFVGKFGTRTVTVVSTFLTTAAMIGFSFATEFWMLLLLAVPYGLGAGGIDAALNNFVALNYASKHMSWLHCFWGVGAIISPFVMGYALANSVWNDGFFIVGCIQLGIVALLVLTLPLWKKNKTVDVDKRKKIGIGKVLKIKGVPFILIGFFCYCATEATAMYWASTYFVEAKGFDAEKAAQLASLFYIGITSGRILSGFVADKLGDRKLILVGIAVLSTGIVLLAIPVNNEVLPIAAYIVIGFGCAPVFPSIIHSAPRNFGKENSGAVIGLQMACAYTGTTFMPPLFGLLGNLTTFAVLPLYLAFFTILTVIMTELTFRAAAKNRSLTTD